MAGPSGPPVDLAISDCWGSEYGEYRAQCQSYAETLPQRQERPLCPVSHSIPGI